MSGDDLSCCPTFDHLQLVDICFSVWAPHGTGIFYYRVKKTKDGLLLSRHCSYIQIPSEKAYSLVCPYTYILHVSMYPI